MRGALSHPARRTYHVSDIDDVILNLAGVLLGYAAYRLARGRATR